MLFFWLWKKKRLIVGKSAAKALMAAIGSLTSRFQGSVANSKSTLFKEGQLARDTSQSITGGCLEALVRRDCLKCSPLQT